MQFIEGKLLHKKSVKIKTGTRAGEDLPVISILDDYDSHSMVVDITDFDNHVNGMELGKTIRLPIRSRAGVSQKGNPYINYVTAGRPQEV